MRSMSLISRPVSAALASVSLLSAVVLGVAVKPAVAAPPVRNVVIGQPCSSGQRGVDAGGKAARCITASYGRIWTWTAPIGSPVTDVAVPPSWSGITNDNTGLNAVPAPQPISPTYADREAMANRLVELVNQWRAQKGRAPLTMDPRLNRLSKFWAERINAPEFSGRTTSHCPASLCAARVNELGYSGFGEVIRPSTPVPAGDLANERYFIDSPPHFAILTDARYTHIGFAFHVKPDGTMAVVGQTARSR
jgi:uncharacterized protein YkwD